MKIAFTLSKLRIAKTVTLVDYKMTKHMLNNCTIKESRTWLLVCTRHCYFIPFNREHPVYAPKLAINYSF